MTSQTVLSDVTRIPGLLFYCHGIGEVLVKVHGRVHTCIGILQNSSGRRLLHERPLWGGEGSF